MEQHLTVVQVDSVPPLIEENGHEQIRRLITHGRVGIEGFSLHVTHFDGGHERDNRPAEAEEVLYALQGDMRIESSDGDMHLVQGSALYIPKGAAFKHHVGPQGLTMIVVVCPPRE